MIKGLIIHEMHSGGFTNLKEVFTVLNGRFLEHNWLFSYYDCYPNPKEMPFGKDYVWLDGNTMDRVAKEHEMQVIWGVLTAYKKEITLEQVLKYELPWADAEGNKEIWLNPLQFQNPLCEIEIIPWDSSLLVVKSIHNDIITDFKMEYPVSEDLEEYNKDIPW